LNALLASKLFVSKTTLLHARRFPASAPSVTWWLHSDHAPVELPYFNDTVLDEPLSCLLDCRSIIGAIHNRWRSGYVIVRSELVNPVRRHWQQPRYSPANILAASKKESSTLFEQRWNRCCPDARLMQVGIGLAT
jgi:hypothetical protein